VTGAERKVSKEGFSDARKTGCGSRVEIVVPEGAEIDLLEGIGGRGGFDGFGRLGGPGSLGRGGAPVGGRFGLHIGEHAGSDFHVPVGGLQKRLIGRLGHALGFEKLRTSWG